MIEIVDLFCGMGGLALGFTHNGYHVTGYDISPHVEDIFEINHIGNAEVKDLSKETVNLDPLVVIGGPPCRPWSAINLTRRLEDHPDYMLVGKFFAEVMKLQPQAFIMENVVPLGKDPMYKNWIGRIDNNYSVDSQTICYSDFGAPTRRKRLFTVGLLDEDATIFFGNLRDHIKQSKTVGDVIRPFLHVKRGSFPDHEWPNLRTIEKYLPYYETGKFGWYKLDMDKPAPSFGNVMKTYILHPLAGQDGFPLRVISIREAMSIMGFPKSFVFPEGIGMSVRYQMVADAVSPYMSEVCATVLKDILE